MNKHVLRVYENEQINVFKGHVREYTVNRRLHINVYILERNVMINNVSDGC